MNETASSCLSLTEKKKTTAHRPSGCVGIFFQLFDWNRRLAKKKLFSRKLLPPARAKQIWNKFGGDEKMPKTKLHLIADENSGGFPKRNSKCCNSGSRCGDLEQKHEMRVPGLVARLMGLESMPSLQKDKPKKGCCDGRKEGQVNKCDGGSNKEDLGLEKGNNGKVEFRAQKLQKTGQFERRAVTRFGAEALQIKGVLSRSRKHQHPRLASPLKSPRVPSGKNVSRTSRLIDAATRILEPGLQATHRAKSALTYSNSINYVAKNEVMLEGVSTDQRNQCGYDTNVGNSSVGLTSCRNCGNLLDVLDSGIEVEEQSLVCPLSPPNVGNISSHGFGKDKPRSPISSVNKERDEIIKQQDQTVYLAANNMDARSIGTSPIPVKKTPTRDSQDQWHLMNKQWRSQKEEPYFPVNQRTPSRNKMLLERDRVPSRVKLADLPNSRVSPAVSTVNGAKDFVALNRNRSGRTCAKVPTKLDNSTSEVESKVGNLGYDSSVRKRRMASVHGQGSVNGQAANSVFLNSRGRQRNLITGKQLGSNANSLNQKPIKSREASHMDDNRANGYKNNGVVSFTFNSPLRQKCETEVEEKLENQNNSMSTFNQRKSAARSDGASASTLREQLLTGDALGALLEEKLKELTRQEEDELTTVGTGTSAKRSTAMILQELISALTSEQPISPHVDSFASDMPFQTKAGNEKGASDLLVCDANHLSPGSVLEASFSNDSCLSSCLDDILGAGQRSPKLFSYWEDHSKAVEPEVDLLDSATSISNGTMVNQKVNNLVIQISRMLHCINDPGLGLTGSKLTDIRNVMLSAELLFGNTSLCSAGMEDLLVAPFLLDELEVLATAMWPKFSHLLGFEAAKNGSQLGGFLFDCLIEYFNTKYARYCNSGFKAWARLPLRTKAEMLIREVGEDIIRWTLLAGMAPDEIIECDMSHSLGKWTDFDIEAFETGSEIGWDILQILVEEIVTDLHQCRKMATEL